MKHPMATLSLVYVAGIIAGYLLPVPLPGLFVASGLLAVAAMAWTQARPLLLWALLFCLGWTNLVWRTAALAPDDLRRLVGEGVALADLRGTLAETPNQRLRQRDRQEAWRSLALVDVCAIRRQDQWETAVGRVVISTPGVLPATFFSGQEVEVSGVIQPPAGPPAEGLFDYRAYLKWQGIYYYFKTNGTNDWRLTPPALARTIPPLTDRMFNWAQATLARGLPAEDEPLRLIWAMTLGWKTALTPEVSEPWMRTGTMHIFAISGLQVTLVAAILVSLLRVVRVPRAACGWLVIPVLWFCTAVTGWQPSAVRSTLMSSIVIAGWALHRPGYLINSLAAAAFLLLLWDGRQLFQASFQLSFFVVLSLALIIPVLQQGWQRLVQPDPLLPEPLRPKLPGWLATPLGYLGSSVATSVAAWLGSLPLIAYYFHLLTPISLLANLVIVPLSSLALMCNLGSLACGSWLAPLTELFNHSGWLWMDLMIRINHWLAVVPGAYWYVPPPGLAGFVGYYALVLAALTGWLWARERRIWVAVGACFALGWWGWQFFESRHEYRLTVLATGGGDAIYCDAPGKADDLLVDCGNASAASFIVKPFLGAQGVNRLPRCLLTHGDARHVGGAPAVVREFGVRELLVSPVHFRSPAYRQLLEAEERKRTAARQISRGDQVGPWTVLHPMPQRRAALADDNPVVLRGEFHGLRILLCSDLSRAGQWTLLDRQEHLEADVVVSGIPTRNEPLETAFLEAVKPRVIILSCATVPANEQAKTAVRGRLEQFGIPVIYTSDAGSVRLSIRPCRWELRTMSGTVLAGRPSSGDPSL